MDVVEHDEGGALARRRQQELPDAGEDLPLLLLVGHADGGRRSRQAEQGRQHERGVLVDPERTRSCLQVDDIVGHAAQDPLEQVQERAERTLAAARDADVQRVGPGGELGEQPRLPDAGFADHAHHVGVALDRAGP